ncbi:hypothetical protein BDV30DRAFT_41200 [Aspergillus minisclerotigenes]|uniref:Uncharacterized protein n=1 Tax=Aspergillus minisclerotigenes TaxID=656917 RepID=A0A5N6IKZ7_9EURO|nr:hypothetical protein BDV30DRAFT_41200 [Aspergillus minisclerotigenes]
MLGKGGRSDSRPYILVQFITYTPRDIRDIFSFYATTLEWSGACCMWSFAFTLLSFSLSTLYFNEGEHTARSDKYDLTSRNYTTNIHLQSPTTISLPFAFLFFFSSCMKECCTLPSVGVSFRCISYTIISTVL